MTREEFLSQLRLALQGKVSSDKVQENIQYYNEYIIEETRKGKSEIEVLQMLGDPGLLAKTIITADDAGKHQQNTVYDSDDNGYASKEERGSAFGDTGDGRNHVARIGKWWKKLLLILTIIAIVLLIAAVISGLIRIFAPLIVPVLVIVIVLRIFGNRRE